MRTERRRGLNWRTAVASVELGAGRAERNGRQGSTQGVHGQGSSSAIPVWVLHGWEARRRGLGMRIVAGLDGLVAERERVSGDGPSSFSLLYPSSFPSLFFISAFFFFLIFISSLLYFSSFLFWTESM
jgi:hypothetical protein